MPPSHRTMAATIFIIHRGPETLDRASKLRDKNRTPQQKGTDATGQHDAQPATGPNRWTSWIKTSDSAMMSQPSDEQQEHPRPTRRLYLRQSRRHQLNIPSPLPPHTCLATILECKSVNINSNQLCIHACTWMCNQEYPRQSRWQYRRQSRRHQRNPPSPLPSHTFIVTILDSISVYISSILCVYVCMYLTNVTKQLRLPCEGNLTLLHPGDQCDSAA